MDVKHFKLVDAIVTSGTISSAAKNLNLTQSALSHQLRELESELQLKIFNRDQNRLVITPAGKIFLHHSKEILYEIEHLQKKLIHKNSLNYTISLDSYTNYYWIYAVKKYFNEAFPGTRLQLYTKNQRESMELLEKKQIDVAICDYPINNEHVICTPLFKDELVLLTTDHHDKLSVNGRLTLHDPDLKIISSYKFRDLLSRFEPSFFVSTDPGQFIHYELTDLIVDSVSRSEGVGVVSKWASAIYLERYKNVKALQLNKHNIWYAIYLKRNHSPEMHKLVNICKNIYSY